VKGGLQRRHRVHRQPASQARHLINKLQTAIDYSTGERFEREAPDALVDYTRTHFRYEEGLMEQNGYPGFTAHRAEHER
jgi:hemerythrin